ncbi:ATP-binding protein [Paenibacillus oceani]|uniref:Circadian input-output histidine kinase CikA n=1 Tax=Paenibacillus oceani TaxID=2772510 RepID=A0A927CAW6_9BACL|nr:ATP-binding protein [Paenibacillus oceani]MBD2863367.1 response regulator [Paenibacillus oceani]
MLRRIVLVCFVALLASSLIPLSILMNRDDQPGELRVRSGIMDLSGWDYQRNERIRLDGEWEFYWNRLLTPEEFRRAGADTPSLPDLIKVPSIWNGKTVNGEQLPAHGYATYRMVLKNVPFDGGVALKKTNIRFSSDVYANGHKLFEDGNPSDAAADYRAGNVPQIGFFSARKGSDIEIVVHVANFDYANSGIPASLYFGEQAAMLATQQKSKAHELGTFAILATLAFIFAICFVTAAWYRSQDYSLLLYALLCLFYAIYNGLVGERVLLMYAPDLPFELMFKIKDFCSLACFIVLAALFYRLKRNIISLTFARLFILVLGVYTALVVVLPIPVYSKVEPFIILVYESLTIWLVLRTAVLYVRSGKGDRLKSLLLFSAILCALLYSVDMILFSFSLKEHAWLGQFYIVWFNLMMLVLVVLRFFEAYHTIDGMRSRLLELDKIKDDFLSNTSHELKTPLSAIVSITDTLLRGVEGPVTAKQARHLAIVYESGKRLSHLVNELLDYSKMKHGDISLHRSGVDLKAVVDSVVQIHAFLLEGKEIEIVNDVSGDLPVVYADSNRLIQILHNLIGNAVKFTDTGRVRISAKAGGDQVEVLVEDTGIGIEASMRERIFQPFEQADSSETKAYGGTGLGLSITKKLVELQGGAIRVESSPGQGSAFSFTIPVSPEPASGDSREWEGNRPYAQTSLMPGEYPVYIAGEQEERILVVDDDHANLQSMINLLRLEGYSVIAVHRGRLALDELSRAADIALVVLDMMMPDMSGYEVLNQIRERYSAFEMPVLMLTAKNRAAETKRSMDSGANDFVGKPYEPEELMARVRSLTRLKASVKTAKEAEIAFLRSQIKPHFLYNALNSIATLCMVDPRKAEELTLQLSQYLRGSFDFKQLESVTTLDREMELVKAYIHIERARFGARLQVEYDVDEFPAAMRMPPLLLQPLVENAIRHGVMSRSSGGTVRLSVKKEGNAAVRCTVEDNGRGMSEQTLEAVQSMDTDKRGVGLWNIDRRLRLMYGEGIRIESAEESGTKVSFVIPVQPNGRKEEIRYAAGDDRG